MPRVTKTKAPSRRELKRREVDLATRDAAAREQGPSPRPFKAKPFVPKTDRQAEYVEAVFENVITFAIGPAGTGKTYCAAQLAAQHLLADKEAKVVMTRPLVEANEERIGFLPGELEDKIGPYMRPLADNMVRFLGRGAFDTMVKNERIEFRPMALMRGASMEKTLIVADEMQNATPGQFKMLMTRIGEGSHLIVDGDPDQSDIGGDSGLEDAVRRMGSDPEVAVVRFDLGDIVRHDITSRVLRAYSR